MKRAEGDLRYQVPIQIFFGKEAKQEERLYVWK